MFVSKDFEQYIRLKLNKKQEDSLINEDLDSVTEVSLNGHTLQEGTNDYDFKDFMKLPNLRYLSFQNFVIDNYQTNIINRIKTIKAVQFTDCKIKSKSSLIGNIEMLSFTSCDKLNSKYFCNLKNLNTLKINMCGKVDMRFANDISNVEIIDTKIK